MRQMKGGTFMLSKDQIKEKIETGCYLCNQCACQVGGEWPEGHVATFHPNTCEICGTKQSVCHSRAWRFPLSSYFENNLK